MSPDTIETIGNNLQDILPILDHGGAAVVVADYRAQVTGNEHTPERTRASTLAVWLSHWREATEGKEPRAVSRMPPSFRERLAAHSDIAAAWSEGPGPILFVNCMGHAELLNLSLEARPQGGLLVDLLALAEEVLATPPPARL